MILAITGLAIGLTGFGLASLVLMRDLSNARLVKQYAVQSARASDGKVEYTGRFRSQSLQE